MLPAAKLVFDFYFPEDSKSWHSDLSGPNVRYWHLTDNQTAPTFVCFWTKADISQSLNHLFLNEDGPFVQRL
jgi:hypothetical protein